MFKDIQDMTRLARKLSLLESKVEHYPSKLKDARMLSSTPTAEPCAQSLAMNLLNLA